MSTAIITIVVFGFTIGLLLLLLYKLNAHDKKWDLRLHPPRKKQKLKYSDPYRKYKGAKA